MDRDPTIEINCPFCCGRIVARPAEDKQSISADCARCECSLTVRGLAATPTPDATITSTVERLEEALKQIEGGSFVGADGYAIKGDWHGFAQHLQNIARRALAPRSGAQGDGEP